jgi:hypothetical protein
MRANILSLAKQFLQKAFVPLGSFPRPDTSAPARRRFRPTCEGLERRDVLSTLFLVADSVPRDPTHFHSFQAAYSAAQNGDVIQAEPGAAAIASVGAGVVGNGVLGGKIGTFTITIDNPSIGAGECVIVQGGGGGAEQQLVLSAVRIGSGNIGDVKLTFSAPLYYDHSGSGATVTTLGQLGISKAITLQGDPNYAPFVVSSEMVLPPDTSNVVFNNLDFIDRKGLWVNSGHQSITVENCDVTQLWMLGGPGDANDLITGNQFTIYAAINGDPEGITADVITNNLFAGVSQFYMQFNGDALVSGNTFNVSIPRHELGFLNVTAMLYNCYDVLLEYNTFAFKDPISSSTDLSLVDDPTSPQSLSANVENNVFNTSGTGVGLYISGPGQALVQGNDFRHNAVGVYLVGDGTTIGTVDLGGGTLGSQGLNNFSTFTDAGVAKGHFAISLGLCPGQHLERE